MGYVLGIIWVVAMIWLMYEFKNAPLMPPEYDDREHKAFLELIKKEKNKNK